MILSPSRSDPEVYPLSFTQESVSAHQEVALLQGRRLPPSMMSLCLLIRGNLDVHLLKKALRHVVKSNPALQVAISPRADLPDAERSELLTEFSQTGVLFERIFEQRIVDDSDVEFYEKDIRSLAPQDQVRVVTDTFVRERETPFVQGRQLGLRVNLLRTSAQDCYLVAVVDHRVSDGMSLSLLRRDVTRLYENSVRETPVRKIRSTGFPQFAAWQRGAAANGDFANDLRYWREQWRDYAGSRIPLSSIPFAHSMSLDYEAAPIFGSAHTLIDSHTTAKLIQAAKQLRVTMYCLFLAAFLIVLRLYSGEDKIAVWRHCANRRTETLNAIGYFIHRHLLGFEVRKTFAAMDVLEAVKRKTFEVMIHEQLPIDLLWRTLSGRPRWNDSGMILDYQADEAASSSVDGVTFQRAILPAPAPPRLATIGVYIHNRGDTLVVRSDYLESVYSREGVVTMIQDLVEVVTAIAEDSSVRVSDFLNVANRYGCRPRESRESMEEFIVRIPSE